MDSTPALTIAPAQWLLAELLYTPREPLRRRVVEDIRIDKDGLPRCWNCGSKGFTEKRAFRAKATVQSSCHRA